MAEEPSVWIIEELFDGNWRPVNGHMYLSRKQAENAAYRRGADTHCVMRYQRVAPSEGERNDKHGRL